MKRKKPFKQLLSEYSYHTPALDKKMVLIKKSFGEVSSIVNIKNGSRKK
ncbi:hypothetical protein LQZ18_14585 [Lachnospiraceae bacterium ZAX-1]